MANKKRLIDADRLIEALPIVTEDKQISLYGAVADFMVMISEMPTVDAVEVVRCRDCTKNVLFTCPICFIENKTLQFINHSPDFYCGEGERRTDG